MVAPQFGIMLPIKNYLQVIFLRFILSPTTDTESDGSRILLKIVTPVLLSITVVIIFSIMLVGRIYYIHRRTIRKHHFVSNRPLLQRMMFKWYRRFSVPPQQYEPELSTDNQHADAGEREYSILDDSDILTDLGRADSKSMFVGSLEEKRHKTSTSRLTTVIQLGSSNHLCSDVEIDSVSHVYISDSKFKKISDVSVTANSQITPSINMTDCVKCGNAGGMYINKVHDVMVTIPEGAVSEGTVFELSMSVMLYGPFIFPAGVRPVSSILWLCPHPDVTFSMPIEIVLPHFICCENQKDTENLIFLKANHHLTDGKFHFKPTEGESHFTAHTSYGTLHTMHCCLLCIGIKMNEKNTPKTNFSLITSYPRNPHKQPRNVHFGVTYLQPTCMQVRMALGVGDCNLTTIIIWKLALWD